MSTQAPDYLAIGHVSVDLQSDGTATLGGTALYAAVTAARFGLRAAILTRGDFTQHGEAIYTALQQFAGEVELIIQSTDSPTVFTNVMTAGRRQQILHAWAGQIDANGLPPNWRSARIIHLAPIAQEINARQIGQLSPAYFGTTPQGWMRQWPASRKGPIQLMPLRLPRELLSRLDALVVNSEEHTLARDPIETVGARGLAVITRGSAGAQVIDRGRPFDVAAYPAQAVDELGAGDVFAAVLFLLRAQHESTISALRMAAAAAALRVRARGVDAVPTRDDVEEFLRQSDQRGRPRRHSSSE